VIRRVKEAAVARPWIHYSERSQPEALCGAPLTGDSLLTRDTERVTCTFCVTTLKQFFYREEVPDGEDQPADQFYFGRAT
jgi:hypothetical protein